MTQILPFYLLSKTTTESTPTAPELTRTLFRGMPGLQSNSGAVSHDRAMVEALEQFCNSSEQSYEQFLSTFTYLTTENVTRGNLEVPRGDNSTSVGRMNRRNREVTDRGVDVVDEGESRSRVEQNHHALTAQLDELVLDGSVIVGRLGLLDALPSDPPVKFDNYLDDMEPEEESLHDACQDVASLPGEVEEDLPVYTPSFCHYTLLELSSTALHRAHTPQTTAECQSETEEVLPFSLDDTFDYDNVVLSHKHPTQHSTSGSS
ncbi:intraflagellar transport-associated protein isoform X2 [Colossoma macropomum]|uniref:intraflagellar transport-associated protein isoform X2 n=1 Tax=Colossoma macropomum TaxID=42526 RepID=UPI0018654CFB|nr:intraflagellar transport-associated protein isoform X2 [Colossoma macropomum]